MGSHYRSSSRRAGKWRAILTVMAEHWRSGRSTVLRTAEVAPLRPTTFYSRWIKFNDKVRTYERSRKRQVQEAPEVQGDLSPESGLPGLSLDMEAGAANGPQSAEE